MKKVDGFITSTRVNACQINSLTPGKGVQIVESFGICDETTVFLIGSSYHLEDHCELIVLGEGEARPLFLNMLIRR